MDQYELVRTAHRVYKKPSGVREHHLWTRNSGACRLTGTREARPESYWCPREPAKKHGPGVAADLSLVTPIGRSRIGK